MNKVVSNISIIGLILVVGISIWITQSNLYKQTDNNGTKAKVVVSGNKKISGGILKDSFTFCARSQ